MADLITTILTTPVQGRRGVYTHERVLTEYVASITALAAGKAQGFVMNKHYNDAKERVNRALEIVWDEHVRAQFLNGGRWESLPREEYELECSINRPMAHTLGSVTKKLDKAGIDSPMTQAMRAVVAAFQPAADLIAELKDKGMIRKRETKAETEAREAPFRAPVVDSAPKAKIRALLTQIAETCRVALTARFRDQTQSLVTHYLVSPEVEYVSYGRTEYLTPYGFFVGRHKKNQMAQDPQAAALVESFIHYPRNGRPTAKPGVDDLIIARAEKDADDVIRFFIEKNLGKLASIIEAKGGFETAELVNDSISQGGLEGTIVVTFADSSRFVVSNAVVWHRNQYGTSYNRFPCTFHAVRLPNGEMMKQPSEKRMHDVFVKAAA